MNSSLVAYTLLSPNCNPRKHAVYNPSGKVTKITIHHAAGVTSVENLGGIFARKSRQASANYGIGSDGQVGLYVPEDHRAWTSGSRENDYRAVTIEVSNSEKGGSWPVSDMVLGKLVDLCEDICRRNGIQKLNYTGDASGNLTMHKYFEATTCPGPYLESKFSDIAREVNKRLCGGQRYRVILEGLTEQEAENFTDNPRTGWTVRIEEQETAEEVPAEPDWEPREGDIVRFRGGLQYSQANGTVGSERSEGLAKITKVAPGARHPWHLVKTGTLGPYGWVDRDSFERA